MKEFYQIGGVTLELSSSRPLCLEGESTLFRIGESGAPQIQISLEEAEQLPEHSGTFCGTAGERLVWQKGERIVRRTLDVCRTVPHIEAEYSFENPGNVQVRVRSADWPWAAGSKYLWPGIAINQLLLHFRTLFFHASYIVHESRAILFTAPSGVGKSTQAELWRRYRGAEIINGDKAAVSLREYPTAHGVPFSGTSGVCRNVSAPLAAVVSLSQAPENIIQRMTPAQAVQALFGNIFIDRLVSEEWSLGLGLVLDLVEQVPVYALACTPDERAVETLERVL